MGQQVPPTRLRSAQRKALHEAARVPPIGYRDNLRRATQGVNFARRSGVNIESRLTVRITPDRVRSNNRAEIWFSSFEICRLTAGCEVWSSLAALVKFPCLAAHSKTISEPIDGVRCAPCSLISLFLSYKQTNRQLTGSHGSRFRALVLAILNRPSAEPAALLRRPAAGSAGRTPPLIRGAGPGLRSGPPG